MIAQSGGDRESGFERSMTIKKGEIVGVTGLIGAGKTELGRAISGVDKLDGGRLYPGKEGALPDTSGRYS